MSDYWEDRVHCLEQDLENAQLEVQWLKEQLQAAFNAGVAAERERCAKVAESVDRWLDWESDLSDYQAIAAEIRRGE